MEKIIVNEIQKECWYPINQYSPPDKVKVIVSDGINWCVAYVMGQGKDWFWYTLHHFDIEKSMWKLPSLPSLGVVDSINKGKN